MSVESLVLGQPARQRFPLRSWSGWPVSTYKGMIVSAVSSRGTSVLPDQRGRDFPTGTASVGTRGPTASGWGVRCCLPRTNPPHRWRSVGARLSHSRWTRQRSASRRSYSVGHPHAAIKALTFRYRLNG